MTTSEFTEFTEERLDAIERFYGTSPPGSLGETAARMGREIRVLRARVAELEGSLGAAVQRHIDSARTHQTVEEMQRTLTEVRERRAAKAMRERAAQVLDGMAALDAERMAEDVRTGDERGAAFWRMRVGRYETAAKRIRALPLTDDAGEESDR